MDGVEKIRRSTSVISTFLDCRATGSISLTQSLSVLRKTIPDHIWWSITDDDSWDLKTLKVYDRVTGLFEKKTATSLKRVAGGLGGAKSLRKRKGKEKTNAKARAKAQKDVKGKGKAKGKARVVDSESEDTSSSEMGGETGDELPSESTKVSSRGTSLCFLENNLAMLKRLQFAGNRYQRRVPIELHRQLSCCRYVFSLLIPFLPVS